MLSSVAISLISYTLIWFCVTLYAQQIKLSNLVLVSQRFQTESLKRITVNFLEMDIETIQSAYASAKIEIFDDIFEDYSKLIATYKIMNGTLPQSFLSPRSYVFIKFSYVLTVYPCPTMRDCVKFAILLDAGPGKNV